MKKYILFVKKISILKKRVLSKDLVFCDKVFKSDYNLF